MRTAPRVLTAAADIDRLRGVIARLREGHAVALHLEDGSEIHGYVVDRPTLQQFFDAHGNEGTNGWVRLDEPTLEQPEAAGWRDVWLDRVMSARPLDPAEEVRLRNAVHVPEYRRAAGSDASRVGRPPAGPRA